MLDLRDNPGGLLVEALKIARVLVPKGEIVKIVERDGTVKRPIIPMRHPKVIRWPY